MSQDDMRRQGNESYVCPAGYALAPEYDRANTSSPWSSRLLQIFHDDRCYVMSIVHSGYKRHPHPWTPRDMRFLQRQHAHDVYHIVLYTEGENVFLLNGRRHHSRPGVLAVSSPGEFHGFHTCEPGKVGYVEVCFALENPDGALRMPIHQLLSIYTGYELDAVQFPVTLGARQSNSLAQILDRLYTQLMANTPTSRFLTTRTLMDVLVFLVQEVYGSRRTHEDAEDYAMLRAKGEIETRYRENLSPTKIAEVANMSLGHFHRTFKSKFKVTPMGYQRELRVDEARSLLLSTNLLVKEVAARVGFSDVFYFSRSFKRMIGMSPTEFRRRHQSSGTQ